jgi:ABC-2 type transport system ATP-binding protein/sodium transport system ATP-binding protein
VLLLDEPTLGLDVLGSQVVAEFVAYLRAEGKAVLLTTHRLDEAERQCDRFGLLHKGRLVRTGTLAELREATGCDSLVDMFLQLTHMPAALATDSTRAHAVQVLPPTGITGGIASDDPPRSHS